jgi:hypothetical protein
LQFKQTAVSGSVIFTLQGGVNFCVAFMINHMVCGIYPQLWVAFIIFFIMQCPLNMLYVVTHCYISFFCTMGSLLNFRYIVTHYAVIKGFAQVIVSL